MKCEFCGYCWPDLDSNGVPLTAPYCHYGDFDGGAPCEWEPEPARYTVMYEGVLFMGDSDGLNCHDYENWKEIQELLNAYGTDLITVKDNEYGVYLEKGEWS